MVRALDAARTRWCIVLDDATSSWPRPRRSRCCAHWSTQRQLSHDDRTLIGRRQLPLDLARRRLQNGDLVAIDTDALQTLRRGGNRGARVGEPDPSDIGNHR